MRNDDKLEYLEIILIAIGLIATGLVILGIDCKYGTIYGLILGICEMVLGFVLLIRTLLDIKKHYRKQLSKEQDLHILFFFIFNSHQKLPLL